MLGATIEDVRAVRAELDCSMQTAALEAQRRAALKIVNSALASTEHVDVLLVVKWLVERQR